MTRQFQLRAAFDAGNMRTATLYGVEHVVVPVIALVADSVVRPFGSTAGEFVTARALARVPAAWNGKPVVADHPAPAPRSANDPETSEAYKIGEIFNARFEDGRLKMDAWLNVVRARAMGGEAAGAVERVLAKQSVEVSVGGFVIAEAKAGTHNGAAYEFAWLEVIPDHLAFLPAGVRGACNIEMGCGAPRAAAEAEEDEMDDKKKESLVARVTEAVLRAVTTPIAVIDEEEAGDEPAEPKQTAAAECSCHKNEGRDAAQEEAMTKQKELAGRLVANTASPFEKEQLPMLEAMSEEKLTALCEKFTAAAEAEPEKPKPVEVKPKAEEGPEKPKGEEKPTAAGEEKPKDETVTLSAAEVATLRATAAAWQAQQAARKAELIAALKDEVSDGYTEDELGAMEVPALEKLAKVTLREAPAVPPVDFAGRSAAPTARTAAEEKAIRDVYLNPPDPYDIKGLAEARAKGAAGTTAN